MPLSTTRSVNWKFHAAWESVNTPVTATKPEGQPPAKPGPVAVSQLGFMHVLDVNGDGLLDALVANQWQDSKVLLNTAPSAGEGISLELLAPGANDQVRAAIGAVVTTRSGAVPAQKAQLYPANGHAGVSAGTLQLASPLGGTALAVTVTWRDARGPPQPDLGRKQLHRRRPPPNQPRRRPSSS